MILKRKNIGKLNLKSNTAYCLYYELDVILGLGCAYKQVVRHTLKLKNDES
jgi:hypothetical protein